MAFIASKLFMVRHIHTSIIVGMSIFLENEMEQTVKVEREGVVPICGSNLSTPVVDTTQHIKEIHYKIGNRLYIENAD
jgi:hypothetical protein